MSEIFGNIAHKNYALTNLQLPITVYTSYHFLIYQVSSSLL